MNRISAPFLKHDILVSVLLICIYQFYIIGKISSTDFKNKIYTPRCK